MDWAGVDKGAKIFVGLRGGREGSARATAAEQQIEAMVLGTDLIESH